MSAALIIAIVLAIAVIYLVVENRGLAASIERDSPILTRYIEACRWTASMRASPHDIDCYAMQRPSENMKAWSAVTQKNPLLITEFRDYLNDSLLKINEPITERVYQGRVIVPEAYRGFSVEKNRDGQWFLGRPKGSAMWWEKCDLCDLLNLGLSGDDLERVAVDFVYRARITTVLWEQTERLAVPA